MYTHAMFQQCVRPQPACARPYHGGMFLKASGLQSLKADGHGEQLFAGQEGTVLTRSCECNFAGVDWSGMWAQAASIVADLIQHSPSSTRIQLSGSKLRMMRPLHSCRMKSSSNISQECLRCYETLQRASQALRV